MYLHRGDQCPYTSYNSYSQEIAEYVEYYRIHNHNYLCHYKDNFSHVFICLCGTNYTNEHKVNYSDVYDGDNKALCLECNTLLDMTKDIASIIRNNMINSKDYFYTSEGIVVLVDITLEEYYLLIG